MSSEGSVTLWRMQATQHQDSPALADLALHEAASHSTSPIREDGLVPIHVIRPGVGRGRGRHLYPAQMLQEACEQGRFSGWKMYVDHQSPEAKRKQQGLPRSMKDLGGVVVEAHWDPTVPANPEMGWGPGAVVGLAKPTRFMRALIEDIPEAIGTSISAQATGIRPTVHNGEHVMLVEGIKPKGSVDWVTEAGAGGRVVTLMESLEESFSAEADLEVLEAMNDIELREYLRENRPELLEGLQESPEAKSLMETEHEREGEHAARGEQPNNEKEIQEMTLTEMIQEALQSEEGRQELSEALASVVAPLVESEFTKIVAPKLVELVEAAMEDASELHVAEAKAMTDRRLEVRDLKDHAHTLIDESRLPETFKRELRSKYDLSESGDPTPALDVTGTEEKSSKAVLAETVEADIEAKREQYRELNPTAVRGQGATAKPEGTAKPVEEGKEGEEKAPATTGSRLTDSLLTESEVPADALGDLWKDL